MILENLKKLKVGNEVTYKINEWDNHVLKGKIIRIEKCSLNENGKCKLESDIGNRRRCIGVVEIINADDRAYPKPIRCGVENGWSLIDEIEDFIKEEEFMI